MATTVPVPHPRHHQVINWGSLVLAGIVATVVMTALLYVMNVGGMLHVSLTNAPHAIAPTSISTILIYGVLLQLAVGLAVAVVYAVIYLLTNIQPSWQSGLAFGLVHWAIAGIGQGVVATIPQWDLHTPQVFVIYEGRLASIGFLIVHLVYGLVLGAIYRPKIEV